jgi:hypothetical protein
MNLEQVNKISTLENVEQVSLHATVAEKSCTPLIYFSYWPGVSIADKIPHRSDCCHLKHLCNALLQCLC